MDGSLDGPQRRKRRPGAQRIDAARGAALAAEQALGPGGGGEPSRSELRNQQARETLVPLAAGERPAALLAAVAVAFTLGAANAIAFAAGAKIEGRHPGAGVLAFSAAMALLAGGIWLRRYLAVLAFEGMLALIVLLFTLRLLVEASNAEDVLLCVGVIAGAGWLFWKLVRVMGRLAAGRQPSS